MSVVVIDINRVFQKRGVPRDKGALAVRNRKIADIDYIYVNQLTSCSSAAARA
jgi:hypothetical protein